MERKHTLLFVDDEPNILNSLRRLFRRDGYEILTAGGGREGLELLAKHEIAVVVSDQRMPEMLGAEFLGRARELRPDTIRIMLTGHSDLEAATQAINEGGVYRYITKPWDEPNLKSTVRGALQRFDLEEENRELTAALHSKTEELEILNRSLEEKVQKRTIDLRRSYEENLQLTENLRGKVRELEGRDRVAQHLLTIHSLDETLDMILEVISETIELDQGIIYLKKDGDLLPAAAFGVGKENAVRRLEPTPFHRDVFDSAETSLEPVNITDTKDAQIPPFAVVPIRRGEEFLGLIEVNKKNSGGVIGDQELRTVSSFALQTAVAICDAQTQGYFEEWHDKLDDFLLDVPELEELS